MSVLNDTLKQIEQIKLALTEVEEKLAEGLRVEMTTQEWSDNGANNPVPSVVEPEPVSEPLETRMEEAGLEFEDKTPPRTDLVCPLCSSKVYDNRPNKRSGQYKETSPDFTCSNIQDCSGIVQGDVRKLRKSWWLNSKDLPQDWINTTVPHNPEADYVDTTKNNNQEEEKSSPF